jgi:hypothetical protein
MKKAVRRQQEQRRRKRGAVARVITWTWVIAAVALVVYFIAQSSGVAYTEEDIGVVNFSELSPAEKRTALEAANLARCTCGCGMTLAQCVSTDMTCPVREDNIQRIRTMVRDADKP